MEFEIGDTVICIAKGNFDGIWIGNKSKLEKKGPKLGQILKVSEITLNGYLDFDEFKGEHYNSKEFIKIDGYTNETKVVTIKVENKNNHKEEKPHSPQNS